MQQVARELAGPDRRVSAEPPPHTLMPAAVLTRRRPRFGRLLARAMPLLMALAAICLYGSVTPRSASMRPPALPFDPEETLIALGLGIDRVSIEGHRRTLETHIFEAVDLTRTRSELSLDTAAISRRIERLPWVLSVRLSRTFPDGLDILIEERTAVAVTPDAGRDVLLDREGRVLGPASGMETGLVRVRGAGVHGHVAGLLALVARHRELAPRLVEAERVGGRRWTLHLVTGTRLELPAGEEGSRLDEALRDSLAGAPGQRLIDRPFEVIDARLPRRIVVRSAAGRPATPAPF